MSIFTLQAAQVDLNDGVMLEASTYLLCQEVCWHDQHRPTLCSYVLQINGIFIKATNTCPQPIL